MKSPRSSQLDDDLTLPGPFDPQEVDDPWFLPPDDAETLRQALQAGATGQLATDIAEAMGHRRDELAKENSND